MLHPYTLGPATGSNNLLSLHSYGPSTPPSRPFPCLLPFFASPCLPRMEGSLSCALCFLPLLHPALSGRKAASLMLSYLADAQICTTQSTLLWICSKFTRFRLSLQRIRPSLLLDLEYPNLNYSIVLRSANEHEFSSFGICGLLSLWS